MIRNLLRTPKLILMPFLMLQELFPIFIQPVTSFLPKLWETIWTKAWRWAISKQRRTSSPVRFMLRIHGKGYLGKVRWFQIGENLACQAGKLDLYSDD